MRAADGRESFLVPARRIRATTYRLSEPQTRMLRSIQDDGNPYARLWGRAQMGAAAQTLKSLLDRGLIERVEGEYLLTKRGEEALRGLR